MIASRVGGLRREPEGEVDEVLDAEALRAKVEDRLSGLGQPSGFLEQRLQGVAQGLAPLSESGLHDSFEQFLVAAQLSP